MLRFAIWFCLIAALASSLPSRANEFPTRPITIVAPAAPGTPADILARLMAPAMAQIIGQPIIVANRTGAGSLIGYEHVAKSPPDGYTLSSVSVAQLASFPSTAKDLRFDPLKDLVPVIGLAESRSFLGATAKASWTNYGEMVAFSKANPGKLNFGVSAPNTVLVAAALDREQGLGSVQIPYSNGGALIQGLIAGDVDLVLIGESAAVPIASRIRVIATTGERRAPSFPDAPTFAELGMPHIPGLGYSLMAPAGTPPEIIDKLNRAAAQALEQPEVKTRFAQYRLEIVNQSPEVAAKDFARQAKLFSDVAARIGYKPQ